MLKFVYDEKEYVLEKDKNVCFLNDEEKPVEGISLDDILNMIDNLISTHNITKKHVLNV